jgi:hypothetical protein
MLSSLSLFFSSGLVVYHLILIILCTLSPQIIKLYIDVELNHAIHTYNLYFYQFSWLCIQNCNLLIICTMNHCLWKLGNLWNYNLCFWLSCIGLGIYLSPFLIYSHSLFMYINEKARLKCHILKASYKYSIFDYSVFIFLYLDLNLCLFLFSSMNFLINWFYQCLYYGIRMWLVFILHSFSLCCFGDCYALFSDKLLNILYYGFLSIGFILAIIVLSYLGIQIYVYLSFSHSFIHSTILLFFLTLSSNIANHACLCLVPVSLVDGFQSQFIISIDFLLFSYLIFLLAIIPWIYHYSWYFIGFIDVQNCHIFWVFN